MRSRGAAARPFASGEMLASLGFAIWSLAIAIALVSVWDRPAPPDQTPGLATALGFDAHGPFRWIAGLMLLPIAIPFLLRPAARRLGEGRLWARVTVVAAALVTLWLTTIHRDPMWATVPFAAVLVVCVLLRHHDAAFTRRDAVLIPVFLTTWLALFDILSIGGERVVTLAALLVLALRLGISLIPSSLSPALAFLVAPLALALQTSFFGRSERYFGWHALAIVVITPLILRIMLRNARRATAVLLFLIYPLALYSYANAMSMTTAEGKPRVNLFEDGHPLLPASEYLRGERPYRDILPAHGLIEDGGFDFVVMSGGDDTIGRTAKTRQVVGNLNIIALYFLAFAVTGSGEAGLFAVLLAVMLGAYTMNIRMLASLAALAFIAAGVRRQRPRLLMYGGAATVLAGATSLDFGAYTLLALVVALIRYPGPRVQAFRSAAIGVAAIALPLFVALAAFGILDDFLYGTFVETLSAGPAYTLTFFTPPAAMEAVRSFPDVLVALLDRTVFHYFLWCAVVVFVGLTVTRRARRRLEPLVILGVWMVASAISYAERHHLYFSIASSIVFVYMTLWLLRRRSSLAGVAIAAAIVMAAPSTHLGVIGWMRQARGPIDSEWAELRDLPRARGALFHSRDASAVSSVQKYIALSLGPDETFFDFTNRGILYFLTRRDCPIRFYEVAFYQTEEQQREVIRRIHENPKVKAALVPGSPDAPFAVDGIPNAIRAPLVWKYLETHFEPDFSEGDVVFWRRKETESQSLKVSKNGRIIGGGQAGAAATRVVRSLPARRL